MVKLELPYLWLVATKRGLRQYAFYRRAGNMIAIKSAQGRRLQPGDPDFFEAYARIHNSFGGSIPPVDTAPAAAPPRPGALARLIDAYRKSPEFLQLARKTRKDYGRYLDVLRRDHGHRSVLLLPRDAVFKLRDEYRDTPRTANYLIAVLRLILSYAEDRKQTFELPPSWSNPARRPKRLRTGDGYRPWEEVEIEVFRNRWQIGTLERTLFETFLNTGQRGGDIAPMIRQQYFRGEISVAQEKTKERVWIPIAQVLRDAVDPWLEQHTDLVLFPTATGRQLKTDHMRHVMREAIRAAALPDDCTLHGLRYTFATRAIEIGLDWQTIESIVGHRTAQMAQKYTAKRRAARVAITKLDQLRPGQTKNEQGPEGPKV